MIRKKEEYCWKYISAVNQRFQEIMREDGLKGTAGYERNGCYECGGLDKSKRCFQTLKDFDEWCEKMNGEKD